ncbi:hypothetical protein [Tsukamurella spumae]|uniref:Phage head morphogenesis domain-containing protein n=1 Tax=Tsukamurella spumae TaxID=44753 RepID=A0A846XBK6_9ACTN|nr:hypothetical protein [Tsukamurella spumae]NKY21010.1 hypothetical protein [Tsukamurella spumae]
MTPAELAEQFELLVDRLGGQLSDALVAAYEHWQSGTLTTAEFEDVFVHLVGTANAYARGGADWLGSAYLAEGAPVTPNGSTPVTVAAETARLAESAATVAKLLDSADDLRAQLDRIGRNEPTDAAQQQLVHTYRGHGAVGYRRRLNAGACELCVWLQKKHLDPEGIGYIYPSDKPMHRHTGCRCTPVPATRKAAA